MTDEHDNGASLRDRLRQRAPEVGFTASMSDACLMDEAAARIEALEAGLELIFLTDWGWKGCGSNVRISGGHGSTAREMLKLRALRDGSPLEAEHQRRARLAMIVAQAIEAPRTEPPCGSVHESAVRQYAPKQSRPQQ